MINLNELTFFYKYSNNFNYKNIKNQILKSIYIIKNIKCFIVIQAKFNKVADNFNIKINNNKNFNNEIYIRYNIIFMLYNICKVNNNNHVNLYYLNNYIFNIYNNKIRLIQVVK